MTLRKALLGVVSASLIFALLSGCGMGSGESSDGVKKPKSTPSPSPSPLPVPIPSPGVPVPSKKELEPVLLEPGDVGTGFRVAKEDGGSSGKPDETTNQRCTDLFHSELDSNVSPIGEAERHFVTTETGPRVIQNVASFASIEHAGIAIRQLQPLANECTAWTETDSTGAMSYTVVQPSIGTFGDESTTVGMTMAGHGFQFQTRFVMLRIGNNACMVVVTTDATINDADVAAIAAKATDKLATLPHA